MTHCVISVILFSLLQSNTTTGQLVHTIWWIEEGSKKKKLLSLLADDTFYRWRLSVVSHDASCTSVFNI